MRREYKIKWTESQWRRLDSAVRRYNNAIRREKSKTPNADIYLPNEVNYHDLKSQITTSRALNNVVNRLSRITRPGALQPVRQNDGSIVTKYERHEFAVLKSVRERAKAKRARELQLKPIAKYSIGSYEQNKAIPDKRKPAELSAKGLRRFIETQEREINMSSIAKAKRYFENYIMALDEVFGGFESYRQGVEEIKAVIREGISSNSEKLLEWVENSPSIQFVYDPYERQYKFEILWEYWMGAKNE